MIWYRHWIEMRGGLCVAGGCMVAACLLFTLALSGSTSWYAQSGRIIIELNALVPQLTAMGPARFLPWAAHTFACAAVAIIVGLFLGGTGIRTNGFQPEHPSVCYTLTLPISRFELLWTRFASACAAVYVLFAAMLVVNCAILLLMRQPVPLGPMAVSSFLAGLLVVPVLAIFGVLIPLWKESVAAVLYVLALGLTTNFGWAALNRLIGSLDIPWLSIGTILLVTVAALSAAAVLARRQEF